MPAHSFFPNQFTTKPLSTSHALWQSFLTQPSSWQTFPPTATSNLTSTSIATFLPERPEFLPTPPQNDLPLPPNRWMNRSENGKVPKTFPLNTIKEKVFNSIKKVSKKGKNASRQIRSNFEAKTNTQNKIDIPKIQSIKSQKTIPPVSRKCQKSVVKGKRPMRNKHDKTYESHPNTSRLIKETNISEQNQEKPASNVQKRVEKSVHLTTLRDDVQEVISKKTVSKDGVEVSQESEIKIKLNLKSVKNDT